MIIVGLLVGLVVLIGLGVASAGLLVVWGAGGNFWQSWAAFVGALRSRGWAETQGTVTRSVVAQGRHRRQVHYSAAVRYSYTVEGKSFVGERIDFLNQEKATHAAVQATVGRYPVGSSVRVLYAPASPDRATLERGVPPIMLATLAWPIVALVGGVVVWLGADIVYGAFAEPPQLGELPSLQAQLGGLLVGGGTLALVIAGVRGLLERKTRKTLRYLAGAKAVLTRDARSGDQVAIFGRAEGGAPVDLPLDGKAVFYLHTNLGVADGAFTQTSELGVRDETGDARVELLDGHSLLPSEQVKIQGGVERWLDEHDLETCASIPEARQPTMKVACIRDGDPLLVVGVVARMSRSRVALRAIDDDPHSLLFAGKPLPDLISGLRRGPHITLALCWIGAGSLIAGAITLLAS